MIAAARRWRPARPGPELVALGRDVAQGRRSPAAAAALATNSRRSTAGLAEGTRLRRLDVAQELQP